MHARGTGDCWTATASIGDDRPPAVRRLRRAPRPLRLWRPLRARPSDRRRRRAFAATCWSWCASWRRRSCAIPAATSSPATTGRTASARSRSARRGWTSPGSRSSPTPSAPTSSSTGAGSPTSSRCSPSISARAGLTTRAVWSSTATIPSGTAALRPAPRPRLGGAARRQVLVPRQRDGRPLADGQQDRDRVRPRRHRGGEADAADRSDDRARRRAARPAATCRPSATGSARCSSTPSTMSSSSRSTPI